MKTRSEREVRLRLAAADEGALGPLKALQSALPKAKHGAVASEPYIVLARLTSQHPRFSLNTIPIPGGPIQGSFARLRGDGPDGAVVVEVEPSAELYQLLCHFHSLSAEAETRFPTLRIFASGDRVDRQTLLDNVNQSGLIVQHHNPSRIEIRSSPEVPGLQSFSGASIELVELKKDRWVLLGARRINTPPATAPLPTRRLRWMSALVAFVSRRRARRAE